ncbi:butyrophilin-like protein 1 [Discoglossus pictus]
MQHWIVVFLYAVLLFYQTINASIMEVTTYLHGSAELPCTFSFVSGPKSLYVSWEKTEHLKSGGTIVHNLRDGGDDNEHQDPEYKGRTELSRDLSRGKLDLILTNVTFSDEGIYYCRAANTEGQRGHPCQAINKQFKLANATEDCMVSDYGYRPLTFGLAELDGTISCCRFGLAAAP